MGIEHYLDLGVDQHAANRTNRVDRTTEAPLLSYTPRNQVGFSWMQGNFFGR